MLYLFVQLFSELIELLLVTARFVLTQANRMSSPTPDIITPELRKETSDDMGGVASRLTDYEAMVRDAPGCFGIQGSNFPNLDVHVTRRVIMMIMTHTIRWV